MSIVERRGHRVSEVFVYHHVFGIPAINVEAGKLGAIAEVFLAGPAIAAGAIGAEEPRHSDPISLTELEGARTAGFDHSDDLMAGDERKFRKLQLAFNRVQVSVTDSAATDGHTNLMV